MYFFMGWHPFRLKKGMASLFVFNISFKSKFFFYFPEVFMIIYKTMNISKYFYDMLPA